MPASIVLASTSSFPSKTTLTSIGTKVKVAWFTAIPGESITPGEQRLLVAWLGLQGENDALDVGLQVQEIVGQSAALTAVAAGDTHALAQALVSLYSITLAEAAGELPLAGPEGVDRLTALLDGALMDAEATLGPVAQVDTSKPSFGDKILFGSVTVRTGLAIAGLAATVVGAVTLARKIL